MKLIDFAYAPESEFEWLQETIDKLPRGRSYILSNCELPGECSPRIGEVGFYKISGHYTMYHSEKVTYAGQNPNLQVFFGEEQCSFPAFSQLKSFIRGFDAKEAVTEPECEKMVVPDIDFDCITDMAKIKVQDKQTETAPSMEDLTREIGKVVFGQEEAVEQLAYYMTLHLRKRNPIKPLSVLSFGPTGTGKSEMAKALAGVLTRFYPDHPYSTVWTELNTFTEAHTVYRLIGAPPGYVGYEDTPVFEAVNDNPYTVFIFDELDKAHPLVLQTFMSILDEGRCAARKGLTSHGREFDFRRCIFIFTSNYCLAEQQSRRIGFSARSIASISCSENGAFIAYDEDGAGDAEQRVAMRAFQSTERARKGLVSSGTLKEIAGRFTCFLEFRDLSEQTKIKILIRQMVVSAAEYGYEITYISPEFIQGVANEAMEGSILSVRSFKPLVEGYILPLLPELRSEEPARVRIEGSLSEARVVTA